MPRGHRDRHSRRSSAGAAVLLALSAAFATSCAQDPARKDRGWAHPGSEQIRVPMQEAIEAAKDACVEETRESKIPGVWFGYSDKFMACMNAHGWIRVGSPL